MKNRAFRNFYIFSVLGVLLAASYPIYMGVSVLIHVVREGAVPVESYPKYVIPYTPIALAVLFGVLILPPALRYVRRFVTGVVSAASLLVFFIAERITETKIQVKTTELVPLEGWQMSLCYVPPDMYETRTWDAVDILLGGYNPAFKIHFYIISVVLILAIINCFCGFGKMIKDGTRNRLSPLVMQAASTALFLGLCILACFTSFYRTGEMTVPAVSAVLMSVFFVVFGLTAGIFTASFTVGKRKSLSVLLPSLVSALVTLIMYIGEMLLLNFNLYRFGEGFFFDALPLIVLSPADILIIILSGTLCALLSLLLNRKSRAAANAEKGSA